MSQNPPVDVLIVGAGHAGVQLAVNLAKSPGQRSVTLIGDEPLLPYERPPLTKRLLYDSDHDDADDAGADPVLLRTASYWERSPVQLRTGVRVVSIDPEGSTAALSNGDQIAYRSLVWAAGGRAVRPGLVGEDLRGVHSIRDFGDLTRLRADLDGARTAVVIGGGYLGLEAAAGLRRRGIGVTLVELGPRLLGRVTGHTVSGFFAALHRAQGVDVRLGTGVAAITGVAGRVSGVRLSDESHVRADVVIIGVGMRPNVEVLVGAGVCGDGTGIEVDDECRTSVSTIYAIGDCAKQVNCWSVSPTSMRVESVHNAGQQAGVVARSLQQLAAPDQLPPRFWSHQFDAELKSAGLPSPGDEEVLRGRSADGSFSVVYLREGRMAAIDTVGRARDFARGQALIAVGWRPPNGGQLADVEIDLPPARAH